MVGIVVVTHGNLGPELVDVSRLVLGPLEQVVGIGLLPHESEDIMSEKIQDAIRRVDTGEGVLVLVDMFGGTPSNLSLRLMTAGRIEVLTGVNLPMLLKVGNSRQQGLLELARAVREAGTRNIILASEFLTNR